MIRQKLYIPSKSTNLLPSYIPVPSENMFMVYIGHVPKHCVFSKATANSDLLLGDASSVPFSTTVPVLRNIYVFN